MPEAKNNEPEQDIGTMFQQATDNDLVESLLVQGDEPERQQPTQQRAAPAPQQRTSGYEPLIRAKSNRIAELSKKLRSFKSSETYVTVGADGERQYDHAQFQEDQLILSELREELRELERKRDNAERTNERNSQTARKLARSLLEREVAKLPKNLHSPVVKIFGQYFTHFEQKGEWGQAKYADATALRDSLIEVLDTVVGKVTRQTLATPAPTGISHGSADEDDVPEAHGTQGESEELDDFTNNMMYAYDQRRANRGKSIGQIRREEREAASRKQAKGGER